MSLTKAIAERNEEQVAKLISEGVDVNKPDSLGFMPLCQAACTGSVGIARMLIHAGADINLCDARGKSPLSWAVYPGDKIDIVKLLIGLGANVNQQTFVEGATPAHLVFFHDSHSILEHLIRAGADLTIKNAKGETSLEVGKVVNRFSTCVRILENVLEKVSEIKNSRNRYEFMADKRIIEEGEKQNFLLDTSQKTALESPKDCALLVETIDTTSGIEGTFTP